MAVIDCFNGDADGICALTQLRLARPCESELITGVKRDINLVQRVQAKQGDQVTVLDVSLDKNRLDLGRVLTNGAEVFYCDHHYAGEIPVSASLTTLINTSANVCTSLLINQHLKSAFLGWAVVGTFGDNLEKSALRLAKPLGLSEQELIRYQRLGIYLNYNSYGSDLSDLYFDPAELYKRVSNYQAPDEFIAQDRETYQILEQGYRDDMEQAAKLKPSFEKSHAAVYLLPNAAWSRRVSGVFGNDLANQYPGRAHAVVTERDDSNFMVSLRAPLDNKQGADKICRQFNTGGGRAAAAGINVLENDQLSHFIDVFSQYYQS